MTAIPVIDLTRARTGDENDKKHVAAQIDKAFREIGFMTITGHGIDMSIFEDVYRDLDAVFNLPLAQKTTCTTEVRPCPWQINGYSRLLEENAHQLMGREGPSDYVEKFSMGRSILDENLPLPFPDDPACANLRQSMQRYYESCMALTTMLTQLFALALDLPEDYFLDKIDTSWDNLRLHRYPGFEGLEHDQGVGAHKDTNFFTVLTNEQNGMEAKSRDGEWIKVETTAIDQFMVNVGDLLQRWSNDEWVSNEHRVTLSKNKRHSVIFFQFANDDALIETFPKFYKDGKSKYNPITFSGFIDEKVKNIYGRDFFETGEIET
jgi:isopenicillin N synthase-like dioxygenase